MLCLKRSHRLLPSFRGMEIRLLVAVYVVLNITTAQQPTQSQCTTKQTCYECIQMSTCAWCLQRDYEAKARCFQPNGTTNLSCAVEHIYNPGSVFTKLQEKKLQKTSEHHEAVQISPQHVNLKLRINEAHRIKLSYAQAEDYPLDLYYLMDLSKTMEDDKLKLSVLGKELVRRMTNLTSDFRLGFGSFTDKVVSPFTDKSIVIQECKREHERKNIQHKKCKEPYSFQNHMQLSVNTTRFSKEVENAEISGSIDAPEGGFDAIMQAVVCRKQIGWREKARRLLVFSTDSGFHYAGDGKLGGIVKPNDGLCHLNGFGYYTYSELQDYPSISQINFKVKENGINIIFAVTGDQINIYENLSKHVEGSTSGTLTNDSSNIVEFIQDQYDKISSSVVIKDNASSSVQVTYHSNCLNKTAPLIQTNKCDGLKVGTKVNFEAEVLVKACPENPAEWKQTFHIQPVGINESLVVDLEMLCDCPCEHPEHSNYAEKAEECSSSGTYKCGICECDHSHFGHKCECGGNSSSNGEDKDVTAGCRPNNSTPFDCSGRGTCICRKCDCEKRANPEERITGPFCECDNFSCNRHNGLLCAGTEHGTCICGTCVCNPGWTGSACDCKANTDTCIPPGGHVPPGEICSGHGDCVCGDCKCHKAESGSYSGRYCDRCVTCRDRCEELNYCVQCKVYKTGPLTKQECAINCTFLRNPKIVDIVQVNEENDEVLCAFYDEHDCRIVYVYSYDEKDKFVVRAQKERECPAQVYLTVIVLGGIVTTVLIGFILLLLWKLLTTIHDRREFSKFEKERMRAKWDASGNPLYKQATSTFENPMYAGEE